MTNKKTVEEGRDRVTILSRASKRERVAEPEIRVRKLSGPGWTPESRKILIDAIEELLAELEYMEAKEVEDMERMKQSRKPQSEAGPGTTEEVA
jgi:hypothetical protein